MEVGELAQLNALDLAADEKCPFCYKKELGHATTKTKKEVSAEVKSVPDNLKCDNASSWRLGASTRRTEGDLPYTVAQHHLISALQCYAQVKRIVRMGNIAGYDINNPNNGIGLPTTHYTLKYPDNGKLKKYGDLDDNVGKKRVSDALMEELGAQWHVGHHSFAIVVPKKDYDTFQAGGSDERNEDDIPHETGYDKQIIKRLIALMKKTAKDDCEEPKRDDDFKKNMDKLSQEIKRKLEKFKGPKPADSSPFFVSMRAYEYSKIADRLPNIDLPGNNVAW